MSEYTKEQLEIARSIASLNNHAGWKIMRKQIEDAITAENKLLVSYKTIEPAIIYRQQGSIHGMYAVLDMMTQAMEITKQA